MQRKRHPSLEARRVARIGTSLLAAAALWLLCVFFCVFFGVVCAFFRGLFLYVFSVHSAVLAFKSADQMYSLKIGRKIKCTHFRISTFLRTHLSYRKISRTHSTPVSSTKLLFVLTSDFCVRLSTHFRCSSFSTVLTSMQGSHSSIFDVLCTHFRFTNKQSYSLPEGNQNVLTSECA